MTKYMNIQKKSLLQRLLKTPWNTRLKPYTTTMAKIQGPKEGKHILIFKKKSGPNLGPWTHKSTLRFMRTLGHSSAALAQFSWSLLLMALVTGPLLWRIVSSPPPWRGFDLKSVGSSYSVSAPTAKGFKSEMLKVVLTPYSSGRSNL